MAKKQKVALNLSKDLESIDAQLDEAMDRLNDVNDRIDDLLHGEEPDEADQENVRQDEGPAESTVAYINAPRPAPEPDDKPGDNATE